MLGTLRKGGLVRSAVHIASLPRDASSFLGLLPPARASARACARACFTTRASADAVFEEAKRQVKPIPRVTAAEASELVQRDLGDQYPVIITGLQADWSLCASLEAVREAAGGALYVQVGSDEEGYRVEVTMDEFWAYMSRDSDGDDDPLYVLDDAFLDELPELLETYRTPALFKEAALEDPFPGTDVDDQPPMRWLVCGGTRSGSAIHVDPVGCAWNALMAGTKRWWMFPPIKGGGAAAASAEEVGAALRLADYDGDVKGIASWFVDVYPNLSAVTAPLGYTCWEGLQKAGDTMYVPPNWLHGVMNLDLTVAVTQNYVPRQQGPWTPDSDDRD